MGSGNLLEPAQDMWGEAGGARRIVPAAAQAMLHVRVSKRDIPPGVLAAMLIGYARVSNIDQNPALQLDALQAAGVERLYTDRASVLIKQGPELQRALDGLRRGDTLVCWRLDRLGRSVAHLLRLAEELRGRGVELRSLTEGIDTSTPAGEAYMTIIAAMAQMERRLRSERTKAGIAAVRRRKGRWGRPNFFANPAKVRAANSLLREGHLSKVEIARRLGISTDTLYRRFPGGRPDPLPGESEPPRLAT